MTELDPMTPEEAAQMLYNELESDPSIVTYELILRYMQAVAYYFTSSS